MFGPNSSQKEGKIFKRNILHLGDMNQILVLKAMKTKPLEKVAIKIVNITNQKELLEVNNAISLYGDNSSSSIHILFAITVK